MNGRALWLACTALTVVAAPTAHAQTVWDGSTSTDWFTASNWSAGVPTSVVDTTIDTTAPNPTVISGGAAASRNTRIGNAAATTGQVTVTGAGANWNAVNGFVAGVAGHGGVIVQNGGRLSGGGGIASNSGSTGTVTVTGAGSTWRSADGAGIAIGVGQSGNGALIISNGGFVESRAVSIGSTAGSIGTATVDGLGSSLLLGNFINPLVFIDDLRVGVSGNGTLNIVNGGSVGGGPGLIIGGQAGSIGVVNMDNGHWGGVGDIVVGDRGSGTLNILNGSFAGTADLVRIGSQLGSTGVVTVSGTNSRWHAIDTSVGGAGNGTLNILNGGAVRNQNAVISGSSGATGTVTVSGESSTWTITEGLTIASGFSFMPASGTLTIQDGGVVSANSVAIAGGAGAVGTLNIGAAAGAAPATPGTLNAPIIFFREGTGQIVFNHTATSYAFESAIGGLPGRGSLLFEAGTTSLTANSTFSGNTTVNGGTLRVNGSIGNSNTTVNAGGTLGGSGFVGNTTINGGTLAPGNSIGTLTVQGSLVFTAAATYLVEVDPNGADRTNVTSTATLGGATVSAIYANGSYVSRRYTILNAAGGVNGSFNALVNTNLPANFVASLSYDPNNVYLDLSMTALNFGLSGNQASVANALVNAFNATGGIPLAFGALTPQGLTQVSGEAATGTQQTTFNAMDSFLNVMTDPFMGERGMGAPPTGATGYADDDETLSYASKRKGRTTAEREAYAKMAVKAPPRASFERRWSVWGAGYGGTQSTDGNGSVGSNDYTARIYGGAAGFDYRLTPDTLVGFALGGAGTTYGLANGLGGGRSEMFQAGVYGRHTFGPAYISAALAYGWQDVTTDRNVLLSQLRANFDANAISGRLEAGYRVATGMGGITPYAAGQFTSFFLPAYAEQVVAGINTFALSYAEKDVTASRSELGLRGDTSFAMQDAIVTLRGRAAWAHNFDTDRSINAIFQTLPAAGFVVNGAAQARDSALVSAGPEAKWLNGFSVAATFEGEFSNVTESYAGKGIVRYQW